MIDWASKWFEVRAELGQSDLVTMMYQDDGKAPQKIHFHHREADGFGKLQTLLKNEGLNVKPPIRPLKKPASFFGFFLLLKGLIIHPRLHHNPWKSFAADKPSGQPDEVGYWFLSTSENDAVKNLAKEKNLNLSFFLLSELDKVIKKKLYKNPEDAGTWLCPVDVRGGYPETPSLHNFVSFVVATLKGVDRPEEVQKSFENYKNELRKGTYWAYWEMAQIGKYIGLSGIKWLAKKGTSQSYWMGSFSDLGVWSQSEICNSPLKDRRWVIAPPGSPAYPIGITTIEWCGHRCITVKVHPAICDNHPSRIVAEEILADFKKLVSPAKA